MIEMSYKGVELHGSTSKVLTDLNNIIRKIVLERLIGEEHFSEDIAKELLHKTVETAFPNGKELRDYKEKLEKENREKAKKILEEKTR